MKTTQLKIEGMTCGGCVESARRALQDVPGVRSANVDLASASAAVEHAEETADSELVAAVTEAGFEARVKAE